MGSDSSFGAQEVRPADRKGIVLNRRIRDLRRSAGFDRVPVSVMRLTRRDQAVDSTDVLAFPAQLVFDTQTSDFTMTPLTWRRVGSSCTPAVACASCLAVAIDPVGDAVIGNAAFAPNLTQGP